MFQFLVKSLYLSLSLSSHPLPPASPSKAFFPCRQNVVSFTNFSSLSSSPWAWTPELLTINTWPFHRTDRLGDENERNFSKMVIKKTIYFTIAASEATQSYWGYNPKKFGHRRFLPSQLHFHPAQPCVGTMERGSLQKCMGGGDIYIYYFSFLFWCSVWTSVSHPHLMSWTLCMNSWQVIKYTISVCVWMCDSVTELLTGSIYAQLLLLRFHVIPIP